MKEHRLTYRYAKALLGLAIEENKVEDCYRDMSLISTICFESRELTNFLKSPIIKTTTKKTVLNEVFSRKITEISEKFINIITTKKREYLLPEIAKNVISLYKQHNNIESATVITAFPLDEALREQIISFVKKETSKKVDLEEVVKKSIIGGAIIRMNNKQLDASISRTMNELKQTFNQNLYIKDF